MMIQQMRLGTASGSCVRHRGRCRVAIRSRSRSRSLRSLDRMLIVITTSTGQVHSGISPRGPTHHNVIVPSRDPTAILEPLGDQDTQDTGLTGTVRFSLETRPSASTLQIPVPAARHTEFGAQSMDPASRSGEKDAPGISGATAEPTWKSVTTHPSPSGSSDR